MKSKAEITKEELIEWVETQPTPMLYQIAGKIVGEQLFDAQEIAYIKNLNSPFFEYCKETQQYKLLPSRIGAHFLEGLHPEILVEDFLKAHRLLRYTPLSEENQAKFDSFVLSRSSFSMSSILDGVTSGNHGITTKEVSNNGCNYA